MKMNEFLSTRAIFTVEEFYNFRTSQGVDNPSTRKALLKYYRKQGRVVPIRRGLYATIPLGSLASLPIDPFLIAAKLAKDAVIAYHTALEFHGKAYSVFNKLNYVSKSRVPPLEYQSHEYICVQMPKVLQQKGEEMFAVNRHIRDGVELKVTNLERTLVDVLARPDLSASLEEIWRSLEGIEFLDLNQVVKYVQLLENATTAAKVGFFVEEHKEQLMADKGTLKALKKMRPEQPHYFLRSHRKNCQLVKAWNLLVPTEVLEKSWEVVFELTDELYSVIVAGAN